MKEQDFQKKMITAIENSGGWAVNGTYTKAGELDLQGGILVDGILRYIAIEAKTPQDYARIMSGVDEVDLEYVIHDPSKLKDQEELQIYKANKIRKRGGLAIIAYSFFQVADYIVESLEAGR
jgi:hypothetical protein